MRKKFLLILAVVFLTGFNTKITMASVTKQNIGIQQIENVYSEEYIDELVKSSEKSFNANGRDIKLTNDEWKAILTSFINLQQSEPVLPKDKGKIGDSFVIYINGEIHNVIEINGKGSSYILVDGKAQYFLNNEFRELFKRYCTDGADIKSKSNNTANNPEARLVGLSIKCDEPKNQKEYLKTARTIVKPWLDSLKLEEGEYKLPSYTFTDKRSSGRIFHGDGYVNGGREFVCYVGFDTPTEDEDSVFYASGTYDTFYHYYFGPGIFARFRWENGVCTLIKYDEAFAMQISDDLKEGLYGISQKEMKYKTFYDFLNDKDNVKGWIERGLRSKLCSYRISHNVMMLSNGKIIFMDIGNSEPPRYNGDFATTNMSQYFYDSEVDEKYSSPVDYIDESGAVVMTYRNGFPIIYDDYNHDGNPDYAIRISSDDYGSTYDVRCMDINGTPWEDNTEVYIYGEFDESIRLQVYNGTSILRPVDNNNGGIAYEKTELFRDKSTTVHDNVTDETFTDYIMYSQRFYLPESLRYYSKEDNEVICYFWNNTDIPVTLDENYEIHRKNGDKWESVGKGSINSTTINGGKYAEVSFNITSINLDEMSLYRIKTTASGKVVYGGFYYGTENKVSLEIVAEDYPSGVKEISFDVVNKGLSAVYLDTAVLYRNGKKLCDIDIKDSKRISSNSSQTITVTTEDAPQGFSPGEYTIELVSGEDKFSEKTNIINIPNEKRFYFSEKVSATKHSNIIKIPLKNIIWNEETASIDRLEAMEVMQDGVWYSTIYFNKNLDGYSGNIDVKFGETVEVNYINNSDMLNEIKHYFNEIKNSNNLDIIDEDVIKEVSSMTFDEFIKRAINMAQPQQGDLCRICISIGDNSEYVYFEMP